MARAKKAKAKARPKKAPKAKAKTRKAKAKRPAKAKPESPAEQAETEETEHEPTGIELMLQTLSCPTTTAERLVEVCEDSVQRVKNELPGVGAAELVWRERADRVPLAAAAHDLANELERHAETMLVLYDRLTTLTCETDHGDLEIADVMDRLRPMIKAMTVGPEE